MYFVHPQIKLGRLKKTDILKKLSSYFPEKQLVFTDMGRTAFRVIVEKLNLRNSEMMLPAYICDIFSPILKQYNIKPIFLDVDLKTFHIKAEEIERKITPNVKSILVCHTYGLPFDVEKIKKFGLLVIEDCAHAFGVKPKSQVAFFSLYKQFPALRGGLLVCPKDWQVSLPETSFNFRDFISLLNCFTVFSFLFRKFGKNISPRMVRREKLLQAGGLNKLSLGLFSRSFDNFEKSLSQRINLAKLFQSELIRLGFEVQESNNNVFCYLSALIPKGLEEKRDKLVEKLRGRGIFCTRIWHAPVILDKEEFPNTFEAAKRMVNFPLQNHYSEKDVEKMISAIKIVLQKI